MTVIVSCLQNVPSKFSQDQYIRWATVFVKDAKCKTIVFCEEPTMTNLKQVANPNVMFLVFPKENFVANQKYAKEFAEAFDKHPEKGIMKSPWLGQIWQEKKEFVKRAMILFPSENYFVWCDIGVLRDSSCVKAQQSFGSRIETMSKTFHILELKTVPVGTQLQNQKHNEYFLGGGILGAHRDVWTLLGKEQDTIFQQMSNLKYDIVKDQSVWVNVIRQFGPMFTKHSPRESSNLKDPWFSMLGIL